MPDRITVSQPSNRTDSTNRGSGGIRLLHTMNRNMFTLPARFMIRLAQLHAAAAPTTSTRAAGLVEASVWVPIRAIPASAMPMPAIR